MAQGHPRSLQFALRTGRPPGSPPWFELKGLRIGLLAEGNAANDEFCSLQEVYSWWCSWFYMQSETLPKRNLTPSFARPHFLDRFLNRSMTCDEGNSVSLHCWCISSKRERTWSSVASSRRPTPAIFFFSSCSPKAAFRALARASASDSRGRRAR